jgi:hypothetical protein
MLILRDINRGAAAMSRKQEIYQQMLQMCIPYIANSLVPLRGDSLLTSIGRMRKGAEIGHLYDVARLIQNILPVLFVEEFTREDLHWLNTHALVFHKSEEARQCPLYPPLARLIIEVFAVVPEEMKPDLHWKQPEPPEPVVDVDYDQFYPAPTK